MAGWLAQGISGNAHAINKTGSMRMQSYRLLAAIPLTEQDKELLSEMEQTTWSDDLLLAAERVSPAVAFGRRSARVRGCCASILVTAEV